MRLIACTELCCRRFATYWGALPASGRIDMFSKKKTGVSYEVVVYSSFEAAVQTAYATIKRLTTQTPARLTSASILP